MTETISLPEAALQLGWSYQETYKSCLRGDLATEKIGKHWAVSRKAVERLKAERNSQTGGEPAA